MESTTEQNNNLSVITAFDGMTQQLRESLLVLEEQVQSRTRDLEIAAEVSKRITSILNVMTCWTMWRT